MIDIALMLFVVFPFVFLTCSRVESIENVVEGEGEGEGEGVELQNPSPMFSPSDKNLKPLQGTRENEKRIKQVPTTIFNI